MDKGFSKMRTKLGQIVELLMKNSLAHNFLDKVLMASPNIRVNWVQSMGDLDISNLQAVWRSLVIDN